MPPKKANTKSVYRLKISLRDIRPVIWRRLEVNADLSLAELHHVVQAAMGWTDTHLHQFEHDGVLYGPPDPDLDLPVENERRVRLSAALTAPGDRLRYAYDFGDGWEHDVLLESVSPVAPGVGYPRVVAGARACPPEDVGGPPGYGEFLKAISDARHPDHAQYLEWYNGSFDPTAFDLDAANGKLRPAPARSGRLTRQ